MTIDDLTIVSSAMKYDGIGKHGYLYIKMLKKYLSINCLLQQPIIFTGITEPDIIKIFQKPINKSKIAFWVNILGLNESMIPVHQQINHNSEIKIAYSMIESTAIPKFWTQVLNDYYDMVVVPDDFLVNVYKNAGVKIPIFVLPLPVLFNDSDFEYQHKKNDVFTFGMTGSFLNKKNHIKLMHAFLAEFKGSKNVKLKLHGRFGSYKEKVFAEYNKLNAKNIEITSDPMSETELDAFMKSLDCLVHVTKGEGFSVCPRNFLALGKPVILSNNTAHKTIVDAGVVIPVKADIKEQAYYEVFKQNLGLYFDCKTEDVSKAMKNVYNNYDKHLKHAQENRNWVIQYSIDSLRQKYLSLLKPTNIILSDKNEVEDYGLKIQNKALYEKFVKVFGDNS